MLVAIYARKSTVEDGDAEAKSIARQIETARAFAEVHGWTVDDRYIYTDDAVSGAETKKLINRQRMLDAIRSVPPFHALVMRDTSRFSRRDGDEVFSELKGIAKAGVEVWFYQDGQRFAYGTMSDNVVGLIKAEAAADYRRQIARWTHDAMARKAKAGHVCGGSVFGYTNTRVNGHVERRINPDEATVVVRVYELYVAGHGLTTIAHTLNAEGVRAPRAQQGRPRGWAPSSLREVLRRPLYRGTIVWNKARKRNGEGQVAPSKRSEKDWISVEAPHLRIVPEPLIQAVDARLATMGTRALRLSNGQLLGRPPGEGARYLLTGLLTCACCGGSMEVLSRRTGKRRAYVYRCATNRRKGAHICGNGLVTPLQDTDESVLRTIEETILNPEVLKRAIAYAEDALARDQSAEQGDALEADLASVQQAIRRLTSAIVAGGDSRDVRASAAGTGSPTRGDPDATADARPRRG